MLEWRWVWGWVTNMMGCKECTCDEHQVLYRSAESLYRTPETNMTLYVNWNLNKNFKKKVVSTISRYFSKCFSVNLFNIQNHPGKRYGF